MGNICQTTGGESERNREVNTDMDSKRNHPQKYQPESPKQSPQQSPSQKVEESSEQDEIKQDVSLISQNEVQRREKKKLAQIDAIGEQEVIYENVIKKEKKKSPFDYQVILNGLLSHFVFAQLQEDDQQVIYMNLMLKRVQIVEKMFYCIVKDADYVFKQGDKASLYFIVERGKCQIIINGDVKKIIKKSEAFGELALLYGAPRSASVKAQGDCAFWAIDRNTFQKATQEIQERDFEENRKFIEQIEFFKFMTEEQKESVASVLIKLVFQKGELIVNEGDEANSYYIIKSGVVSVLKNQQELRKMTTGDTFGEQALYENCKRGATVKALEDNVVCISLGREAINKILGDKIQLIMYNNLQKWSFQKHSLLNQLTKIQIEKLIQQSQQNEYQNQHILINEGNKVEVLYIIIEGELKCGKTTLIKGDMFGDHYLQKENRNQLQTFTYLSSFFRLPYNLFTNGRCVLSELKFKQFFSIIGADLETVLIKNQNSYEKKYISAANKDKQDYSKYTLQNLEGYYKLGEGQFSKVLLVKAKVDKKYYALKCISKSYIVESNLEKYLSQEKQVLGAVQFPFIVSFLRSLKDEDFIYFLQEYIAGVELFDAIREIGLLKSADSQFYIGALLLCMEYLHSKNIIYRDIKPENVMVDHQGYIKLIDMGTAKYLKQKGARTFTIIGTPHYMAPEILQGKGYTYLADLWSLGILFFELMCGYVPFAEDGEDPYQIYEEIKKNDVIFPKFLKDKKGKKLIHKLLNKTPEVRLGGSYEKLKSDPWFEKLEWDELMEKKIKPPYIPDQSKIKMEVELNKLKSKNLNQLIKQETEGEEPYRSERARDKAWDEEY